MNLLKRTLIVALTAAVTVALPVQTSSAAGEYDPTIADVPSSGAGLPHSARTTSSTRDWRKIAVPRRRDNAPTALDYHRVPFAPESPTAKEPLVDVGAYGIANESYYARTDGFNAPYYHAIPHAQKKVVCRRSVAERLRAVNSHLRPYGVELFVLDGWRPLDVQRGLWNIFLEEARKKLHTDDPKTLKMYAGKFCSNPELFDPGNEHTWPTHVTGGAVDLTLRRLHSSELLFMGGIFDDVSPVSFTDYYERRNESNRGEPISNSDADACRNRRLLYWAMRKENFVNYPYEWWHFDYGTQMWVTNWSGANPPKQAIYKLAGPDSIYGRH
jgi:zinc D-Ala-D-Ala dipeptidase